MEDPPVEFGRSSAQNHALGGDVRLKSGGHIYAAAVALL